MDENIIFSEITRFADLDSTPTLSVDGSDCIIRIGQGGEDITIRADRFGGRVIEKRGDTEHKYKSYKGLLASPGFGNLRRLVESQKALIRKDAPHIADSGPHLPTVGDFAPDGAPEHATDLVQPINLWLSQPPQKGAVRALVIDGPAGIGKTHVIRQLSYERALQFGPGSAPPILHVQSRGKKLTTLIDVIASTLQAMRVQLTFEQVPILARHGLLHIAIDGFDELADPNGYETAWGSLRDFIDEIAGESAIILAGRDTFITVDSVKRALPRLNSPLTVAAHLMPLPEASATDWLIAKTGLDDRVLRIKQEGLFEENPYALRPFFISKIAEVIRDQVEFSSLISFPLHSLISAMIDREAAVIKSALRESKNLDFAPVLRSFFEEVAREMADSEAENIDESALQIIAEIIIAPLVNEDEMGAIRHRITSVAMLEQDVKTGSRRFPHSEILTYFLAQAYVKLIGKNEIPKSLRRNIIGTEFLDVFHDVVDASPPDAVDAFRKVALSLIGSPTYPDRVQKNLPSLLLASLCGTPANTPIKVHSLSLDEACLRGQTPPTSIHDSFISKLDIRGADISGVDFRSTQISTLVVDETSLLPNSIPHPSTLSLADEGRLQSLYNPADIANWIRAHSTRSDHRPNDFGQHEVLFEKICRTMLRQNWIRRLPQDRHGRLLEETAWVAIEEILLRHNLVSVREDVGVAGPRSDFIRIHRAREFLDQGNTDPEILRVRTEIRELDSK